MKIWYDACTGKHIRYGTEVARQFRKLGCEVVFTTRKHPDTICLAEKLGENLLVIGKYQPSSLHARLRESSKRILEFLKLFKNNPPDLAISHQSVELCRVAFGLKIPTLLTADTPHAEAVNKLTIPLAHILVTSKAIPKKVFTRYGAAEIVQFEGVDEAAWIKTLKPLEKYDFPKPLIVVRQMESKAVYALGNADITLKIAKKLANFGNVLFLSRYSKPKVKTFLKAEKFLDTATLVSSADLVVSVGGTIAREAALQGIPSLVIGNLGQTYVNQYLALKGFPIFFSDTAEAVATAKKHLGKKWNVQDKLERMENPIDIIEKTAREKVLLINTDKF